MRDLPRTDAG